MRPGSAIYYNFLCACLRSEGASARTIAETPGWEWEQVIDEASRHSVLPSLSLALQNRINLEPPPAIADFLSAIALLNCERNTRILREVEIVAGLLNEVGIEPVLLKGVAYLVADIYADSAERYLGDIDILVSKEI